ncbi:MAG: ACP S-malonyltransferase, partial [Candidatus Omnitrophica bacterium]|nr:ACP S-malonyltransferase [Candidatus Omnitrophota bacterium]
MGADFYKENQTARKIFNDADHQLGFSLSKLCFEGPDVELTRTMYAQVSIFVTSIAVLESVEAAFPHLKPSLACGLSLGEFSSLVALDAISFEDGLALVKKRGQSMEEAAQKNPGTMASIIGLT